MSSINGYVNAIGNGGGSSFATALGTYDTGNAQLAGYDRSMAGHSAAIGYDCFRFLHSRYPVRSGHFGYEDFAFLELVDMGRIQNYMYAACYITRAGRQAFNDNFAISSHFLLLFRCTIFFVTTAPYGFRTGLQDVNLVIALVNAPFHVHVAAIVCFNFLSAFSQLFYLLISQLLLVLLIQRNNNFFAVAVSFTDQLNVLRVNVLFNNLAGSFIYSIVIRSYGALNNIFAQAPCAFDEDVLVVAGSNVNSEHNACSLGEYHHLYCSAQCYIQMIKALFFTVVNRTVGKAGSIAFLNLSNDGFCTLYVQVGVLLACKACIRQILCGSAAANSNERISLANLFTQLFVSLGNHVLQILRHFFVHNCLADLSANLAQLSAVVYVQTGN